MARLRRTAALLVLLATTIAHELVAQDKPTWQGYTYFGLGRLSLDGDGDSLDFNGTVLRAGVMPHIGLPLKRGALLLRPSAGLTLSGLSGIASNGRGVAAGSVDIGGNVIYASPAGFSLGVVGEIGRRFYEYRESGPIENIIGGHRALGVQVGIDSRRLPWLKHSPGHLVLSARRYTATLTRSDSGNSLRDVAETDVSGWGYALSWESRFRGGWFKDAGRPQGAGLPSSFAFMLENDAFVDSDTGYTNAVRAMWTGWHGRVGSAIRRAAFLGLRMEEPYCGIIVEERKQNANGPCWIVSTAIGQAMFTPSDLRAPALQLDDRPFAGILFASARAQRVNQTRYVTDDGRKTLVPMFAIGNDLVLGVKGPSAGAAHTQALAHWTWSSGAVRPTGWRNQLRDELAAGITLDAAFRTRQMERCLGKDGCTGHQDEMRWLDLTPRSELVLASHMVRASVGGVLRAGFRFPSLVSLDRLSSTANVPADDASDDAARAAAPTHGPFVPSPAVATGNAVAEARRCWALVFLTADARAVGRNAFLEGGFADDGPQGWASQRGIEREKTIGELGAGVQVGVGRWVFVYHLVHRQGEYRLIGQPRSGGLARYVSFSIMRTNF